MSQPFCWRNATGTQGSGEKCPLGGSQSQYKDEEPRCSTQKQLLGGHGMPLSLEAGDSGSSITKPRAGHLRSESSVSSLHIQGTTEKNNCPAQLLCPTVSIAWVSKPGSSLRTLSLSPLRHCGCHVSSVIPATYSSTRY